LEKKLPMENEERDDGFEDSPGFAPISSQQGRDRYRAELLAALPRSYSPWLHLLAPSLVVAVTGAVCVARIDDLRAIELTVVPVLFVLANAFEWRLHKSYMHRPRWPLRLLYEQHTLMHHRLYVEEDMDFQSFREAAFVLFPWYAVPLVLVGTSPIAAGLWLGISPNTGLLFVFSCVAYVLCYEWLHMSFHFPRDSFVGRRRLVRWLARHHARHHAPRRMAHWNMNVVFPLWDHVRRTVAKDASPATSSSRSRAAKAH
jgi:hypothetical protein